MEEGIARRNQKVAESREAVARQARPQRPMCDLDEVALVLAMRRGDAGALDEFLIRYDRLLFDRARAARIARIDCEDCITELLEEVAEGIVSNRLRQITSLSGFLVRSFRNRYANLVLARDRRDAHVAEGVDGSGYAAAAQIGGSSEHAQRSSRGPEWQPWPITPAIDRLASALDEGLTAEERLILGWLSNHVPQRIIAEWLGMSYAGATQRIWRLRERMREMLMRHSVRTTAVERRELDRFFRRAGVPWSPETKP